MSTNEGTVRLQSFLADCGVASRRASERIIEEGRVKVNGQVARERGTRILPTDAVVFDGRRVHPIVQKVYVALHKPRAYVCTNSDPEGRPLAVDLLRDRYGGRLFSIGRLDYLSSGLLLFTNDGELAKEISHPSAEIEREYLVTTERPVATEVLESFVHGVQIDGVRYRIRRYEAKSSTKVAVVLTEGKNREIRRLFQARAYVVRRIHRIRIGPVHLDELKPGRHRALTPAELASLHRAVRDRRH